MLRVLYVVHSIPAIDSSGTPYAAWRVAKLAQQLHGVEVAFLIPSPDNKTRRQVVEQIPVYMLPVIEFMSLLFADARAERSDYLAWVDASIRDFQPNVIHVYNFVGASYQLLRLREKYPLLRIVRTVTHTEDVCFSTDPLMLNARGTIERCTGPFPIDRCVQHFLQSGVSVEGDVRECIVDHYRQLNTYYQKYIDGVIFSGDLFRGFMMKIFALPRNCWVVPYGVEPVIAKNVSVLTDGFLRVRFFGGFGPRKGIDVLLRALLHQPAILQSIHVTVIGTIVRTRDFLKLQELQKQFPTRIEILGRLDDAAMDRAMRETDIAVLPTYFETYNLVLRELLVRGTPSIVTDTYGSEIIEQGVNGFVFPTGDASALLSILQWLIDHPEQLYSLSEGAKRTAVPTLEDECGSIVDIYRQLTAAEATGVAK